MGSSRVQESLPDNFFIPGAISDINRDNILNQNCFIECGSNVSGQTRHPGQAPPSWLAPKLLAKGPAQLKCDCPGGCQWFRREIFHDGDQTAQGSFPRRPCQCRLGEQKVRLP